MDATMNRIGRDVLKAKLDRGDGITLVMAQGAWAYRARRIPGSLHFATPEEALQALDPQADIVVYCANSGSIASVFAYRFLEQHGFTHLYRYPGGVADWDEAGYPLEGEMV